MPSLSPDERGHDRGALDILVSIKAGENWMLAINDQNGNCVGILSIFILKQETRSWWVFKKDICIS